MQRKQIKLSFLSSSSSSSSNVTTTSGPSPVPQPDRATSDGKRKVRQYSSDYLKFGFIPAPHDKALPMCLICKTTLCNEAMKLGRLKSHMTAKHSELQAKPISFFENLRDKSSQQKTITNLIASRQIQLDRGTMASYQISHLIAKQSKPHTVGEDLIKPAISIFLKTVLQQDDSSLLSMPLSNNTVSKRIDSMAQDVECQLVHQLKEKKFALQLDESTVRDGEALLLAYVRFVDNGKFCEEMLFCETLPTDTKATSIFQTVNNYLHQHKIPITSIVSCTADGTPIIDWNKKWLFETYEGCTPLYANFSLCDTQRELGGKKHFACPTHSITISCRLCKCD